MHSDTLLFACNLALRKALGPFRRRRAPVLRSWKGYGKQTRNVLVMLAKSAIHHSDIPMQQIFLSHLELTSTIGDNVILLALSTSRNIMTLSHHQVSK